MKREAVIRLLRQHARRHNLSFEIVPGKGKGSHYFVKLGDRTSTLQSGEYTPQMIKTISKQLQVDLA